MLFLVEFILTCEIFQSDVHNYSATTQKDVKFLKGVQEAMTDVAERDLYWDQKVGLYYHTQIEKVKLGSNY
jgi:hypothetical protein